MFEFESIFNWGVFPKGPINSIPALSQIMALRRPGAKPFSETMFIRLPAH